MRIEKPKYINIIFAVVFMMIFSFNIWKTHYGFPSPDETFYISMVQRFWFGDIPVIHEWNPAQFPAILMIPLYSAFMFFSGGSTDGVILYFRFLYVFLTAVGCVFIYSRTRQYGIAGLLVSFIYMLYTFGNIQTIHYDTIGLFCMVMFSLFIVIPARNMKMNDIAAGVFFAIAVLCTPYLAIAFFAVSVYMIVMILCKKNDRRQLVIRWIYVTAGCVISAVFVCGFLLTRSDIANYIRHFPLLFSSTDTTYSEAGGILYESAKTLYYGWLFSDSSRIYLPIHLVFIITIVLGRQKNRIVRRYAFPFLLGSHVILMLTYWKPGRDFSMLTFTLLGFLVVLFDRQYNREGFWVWVIGLIYGWMADLTSDTLLGVLSSACTVCALGAVIMSCDYIQRIEVPDLQKAAKTVFAILITVFISMECIDKLNYTYQDISPLKMDAVMDRGPAGGIHTRSDYATAYNLIIDDLDSIDMHLNGENVLLYSNRSWIYLYMNGRCASYSTWFKPFENHFVDILPEYFQLHPEKIPAAVYMPKNEVIPYVMQKNQLGNVEDLKKITESFGLKLEESKYGYYIK